MSSDFFKTHVFPHLIAIFVFLVIAAIFSYPLFQGQKLKTHDYSVYQSVSKEKTDYEAEHGRKVLWTNSMFGGMPTYVITTPKQHNVFEKIYTFILFDGFIPFSYIFWYFMGFYIMLLFFKFNPYMSLLGALFFGLSSYLYIIISAGHFTKSIALGFMAPVIGGVYIAYRQKLYWAGMMLMSFFLALQILSNHVQIVYYTFIIALIFAIYEFVTSIKEKQVLQFAKASAVLVLGAFIAVAINAAFLITTNEYIPYSQRGPSELASAEHEQTGGLDRSYAVQWSYGIDETLTLLIPNIKGGSSTMPLDRNSSTFKVIERNFGNQTAVHVKREMTMPFYFGNQPFTSGPVYVGAFVVFLFIFGLFIVKGTVKWWLLTATILSILLAWGKNFMWFSDLFFDYFPYYNKFRVVAMTLVIAEFTIALLAILAVRELFVKKFPKEMLIKWFSIALVSTSLITLIFIVAPSTFGLQGEARHEVAIAQSFSSGIENAQVRENFQNSLINAIYDDRASLVRSDAFRSLVFILLGALVIYLVINSKIKPTMAIAAMVLIAGIDLGGVSKRYLNEDNFAGARLFSRPFEPTKADNHILHDSDPHFRVLNTVENTFNDGRTSFFHKSVGGYSAAKIRRYQELFNYILSDNFAEVRTMANIGRQNGLDESDIQKLFDQRINLQILNMLNTKYFIYNYNYTPVNNINRFGNAWIVSDYILAEHADDEIKYMKKANLSRDNSKFLDLREYAVINRRFISCLDGFNATGEPISSNEYIKLTEYAPDYLIYEANTNSKRLVVFSEIFYPHGWQATINGEEIPHFRANYVLRAMIIPEGNNTIEFKFEPKSYTIGKTISYIASFALILLILGRVYIEYRRKNKEKLQ